MLGRVLEDINPSYNHLIQTLHGMVFGSPLEIRAHCNQALLQWLANATLINDWLAEHQPEARVVAVGRLAEALGTAEFNVRGETITALAQPHRF